MKLSFTLTFEDHAQGHALSRKSAPGEGPGWGERLLFLWIFLGAIGLLFLVAVAEAAYESSTGRPVHAGRWAAAVVAPWLMYVVVFGLLWYAIAGMVPRLDRRAFRRLALLVVGLMLLLNAANAVIYGVEPAPAPPPPSTTGPAAAGEGGVLLAWLPWAVIFGCIWFAMFRHLRGSVRRNWEAQPHLQRPQTLELTPHGVRFDDAVATRDYRWAGFTKWREGDALFLLYVSDLAFHAIPKRAFPGPAEVDAFRDLLLQHVRPVDRAPLGFPVQPPQPRPGPPPLPNA